ncbi:MAG TPA: non-homologous end-joining DNA ligase [Candidatus Dormibacteraeota bacterium]|nr:non-homologous end-joining DNA ligase [Candidatus Dormibacteraeota bacterium]
MAKKLAEYEAKRDFKKTPEPGARVPKKAARALRFVVQEHHARRLHWDFRLEREGVGVSWAVPKGIPPDPKKNHLAVHVEDHPLEYFKFAGQIPQGEYGAGKVLIWDEGTYEPVKWSDREVMVDLHGKRLQGRYVLFRTRGDDWMIHRMDPPQDPDRQTMPERLQPMLAKLVSTLPSPDGEWGFEFKWDGIRALAYVEGGRVRLQSRTGEDITPRYPEIHPMGRALGSAEVILDGEIVALDEKGRPSFEEIQQRMGLTAENEIRRKMKDVPVTYMAFDILWRDGHSLMGQTYVDRRRVLAELKLTGASWQTPPYEKGGGQTMKEASARAGLEGVMAKKLDSKYEPGKRNGAWQKIKNRNRQELVIGGWLEGEGKRHGYPGALLVGYYDGKGKFVYAGKVGTGFTDKTLDELNAKLKPLAVDKSPFEEGPKPPRAAHFVKPKLVAEFEFVEWTRGGQLRAPAFKGFRVDKPAKEVVREGG